MTITQVKIIHPMYNQQTVNDKQLIFLLKLTTDIIFSRLCHVVHTLLCHVLNPVTSRT